MMIAEIFAQFLQCNSLSYKEREKEKCRPTVVVSCVCASHYVYILQNNIENIFC